jgi:REP element-mobilizing transposase RayT
MKNHFHLCIQVREECELPFIDIRNKNSINNKWKIFLENDLEERYRKKIEPNSMIRFLFNSYAKWFNIKYSRTGSLFEKNFKRKIIEEDEYLKELIVYINTNPIKHSIVNKPELYEWTSYKEIINEQYVLINNQLVLDQFGSLENFKFVHENKSYK